MPSARARRRGDFLNCRFAVYGIQKADCSSPAACVRSDSARLFMPCLEWSIELTAYTLHFSTAQDRSYAARQTTNAVPQYCIFFTRTPLSHAEISLDDAGKIQPA